MIRRGPGHVRSVLRGCASVPRVGYVWIERKGSIVRARRATRLIQMLSEVRYVQSSSMAL